MDEPALVETRYVVQVRAADGRFSDVVSCETPWQAAEMEERFHAVEPGSTYQIIERKVYERVLASPVTAL